MKNNDKMFRLMSEGISPSMVLKMDESQINILYKRLIESKKRKEAKEAVTKTSTTTTFDPSNELDRKSIEDMLGKKGVPASIDPNTKKITIVSEDDEEGLEDLAMAMQSKDINEKFESEAQAAMMWARCGKGKTEDEKKWCSLAKEFAASTSKKDYKKMPKKKHPEISIPKSEYKENYNKMLSGAYAKAIQGAMTTDTLRPRFTENYQKDLRKSLEKNIDILIEKHLTPKISKKELINLLKERSAVDPNPVITPTRPKPDTRPRPSEDDPEFDPFINPDPKDDPEAQKKFMDFLAQVKKAGIPIKKKKSNGFR